MKIDVETPFGDHLAQLDIRINKDRQFNFEPELVVVTSAVGDLVRIRTTDSEEVELLEHELPEDEGLVMEKRAIARPDGGALTIDQLIRGLMRMRRVKNGDSPVYIQELLQERDALAVTGIVLNGRGSVCLHHS